MSQSLKTPANAAVVERFGEEYLHRVSGRHYRIDREANDTLVFRRFMLDQHGEPINEIDIEIDFVIGSGNRARSYLYRAPSGELFMLPISWYTEDGLWRMSPGFEGVSNHGLTRKITQACMFCHNAFPDVPLEADAHWAPQTFPETLPQGIGCQRCHGPGANHVRTVLAGGATLELIHDSIVNPAKLEPEHRDSVCFQCHLLPAESVEGVRRFGRGVYSFRPGEKLSDYIANIEPTTPPAWADRLEINHHAYRLSLSACYQQSDNALTCITCHDPHQKPPSEAFRQQVSAACLNCHPPNSVRHSKSAAISEECVACHMPTRRTTDVVEVTMTDHRIAPGPFDSDTLTARREKVSLPITAVGGFDFNDPMKNGPDAPYDAMAALRAGRNTENARSALAAHLQEFSYDDPDPYIDLTKAHLSTGNIRAAEQIARQLVEKYGDMAIAYSLLGTSLLAQQRTTSATAAFKRATDLEEDPEILFNLAAAQLANGFVDAADTTIDRVLRLRPLMAVAWKYRGLIRQSQNKLNEAEHAFKRSLAIEPGDMTIYPPLIALLRERQRGDDAERYRWIAAQIERATTEARH